MTQPYPNYPPQPGYPQPDPNSGQAQAYGPGYPPPVQGFPPAAPAQPNGQGYAPAPGQPGTNPQVYAQPQYPGQPSYPNPGTMNTYGAPLAPGQLAPQPQYGPPQQAPVQQGAPSTLADFYSQPNSANGPSLTKNGQVGYIWVGVVARDVLDSDVKQATKHPSQGGGLDYNRDGTPKLVMMIPLERVARMQQDQLYASPEHPEGTATLYIQGANLRTEFARACTEAGMPQGTPPRKGTVIMLELRGKKPTNGGNGIPANDWACTVTLPAGQAPVTPVPPSQALAPQQPAAPGFPEPQTVHHAAEQQTPPGAVLYDTYMPPQVQQPAQPIGQQPMLPGMGLGQPLGAPAQQPQAQPQQAPQAAPAPGQGLTPPAGLSESEAAILARMSGQQGQQTG